MLNRRDFIKGMSVVAAAGTTSSFWSGAEAGAASVSAASRNRTPYQNIDWEHSFQIHTTTHGHIINQQVLTRFLNRGFEFLTISNYYPSAPYYPLDKMTVNYYLVHHDHPVMVNGKMTPGPFNWNDIVKPWISELDEKSQKCFPFREGGKLFTDYPKDILQAPNAEHHSFIDSPTHLCAPGSNYASGTFDARDRFQTKSRGGYNFGTGLPWREAIDRMLDGLIFSDGGGVTINHPAWTRLKKDHMFDILDYDARVLGIEVFNRGAGDLKAYPWSDSFSENYWDDALSTGRQCFGFFVPDWAVEDGVNILLVPERSAHECLKAYRQGNWYGAVKGRGILNFKLIDFDGKKLRVRTDKKARFQVIARSGSVFEKTDDHFEFDVAATRRADYGYLRVKAFALDDSGEILFSQPFMLS